MAAPIKGSPKTVGSGRKKGTPNKSISPLKERAQALGVDPFEVLLLFAKGDWKALGYDAETYTVHSKDFSNELLTIQPQVRAKAAAEACQYLFPKLKAIEHTGKDGTPLPGAQIVVYIPSNGREVKKPEE